MKHFISCLILLAIAFAFSGKAHGQNKETDSLRRLLKNAKEDSNKVLLLYQLGMPFEAGQPDTAIAIYEQAKALSQKLGYRTGRFKYYSYVSAVYNLNGEHIKALEQCRAGVDFSKSNHNELWLAKSYINLSNCFLYLNKWDSAIYYYDKGLPFFLARQDTARLALVYSNITEAYRHTNQLQKGLEAAMAAMAMAKDRDPKTYLGAVSNAGNILSDMHRYDEAAMYYAQAEILAGKLEDTYVLSNIYTDYCDLYQRKFNAEKLLYYARKFYALNIKQNNKDMMIRANFNMANGMFLTKHFDSAGYYVGRSVGLAERDSSVTLISAGYRLQSYLGLLKMQDMESFMRLQSKADSIDDVKINTILLHNTQELQEQYETGKKEQQLAVQATQLRARSFQNKALTGALIGLLAIAVLAFLAYRNKQRLAQRNEELQNQKIRALENEKQLTATQAVLQGQDEERTRLAKDLHDGLGGMLSGIKFSFGHMKENLVMTQDTQQAFERSMDMLDTSIKELRRVAHNMMPESLVKFGLDASLDDLCRYLNRPGVVRVSYQSMGLKEAQADKGMAVNVYRIVQELVNNALKHAAPSQILVQIAVHDLHFAITVEDNGRGFDVTALKDADGIGWSNIRNRIDYLNGTLDVQSAPQKGTSVLIEFNLAKA